MATERLRISNGMLEFWRDLLGLLPRNVTVIRMVARWFRRDRIVQEGIDFLFERFPNACLETSDAMLVVPGLIELQAFDDIRTVVTSCLSHNPQHDGLRLRYIRYLAGQSQYLHARSQIHLLVQQLPTKASDAALIADVLEKAQTLLAITDDPNADVVATIALKLSQIPHKHGDVIKTGLISFFTGTLGQGGAEQQMVRIASALKDAKTKGRVIGHIQCTQDVDVVVRSARAEGDEDFFRQLLDQHEIPVTQLVSMASPSVSNVVGNDVLKQKLLSLLPPLMQAVTLKLAHHYLKTRPSVVYLWQDGAVLDAVIAALLAGVPRIVTSFRGLPPGVRPELMRPHMAALFSAMAQMPQVTLTANSRIVAAAYENWLGLAKNTVRVIYNAAPSLTPDGDKTDHQTWASIIKASPDCTKTVIGIFRHDQNKRSRLWVEVAAQVARQVGNTRFIILGHGSNYGENVSLVSALGMENRIFLPGIRRNIGYYLYQSDLLLHLSRMEGLPNALLEAHTCGVPVVTTPAGGAPEIVNHGATGHILSSALELDAAEAIDVLIDILGSPDRLVEMGQRAQKDCRRPFNLDLILLRTLETFGMDDPVRTCCPPLFQEKSN